MKIDIRSFERPDLPGIVRVQNIASVMHRYSLSELERDLERLGPELQHHFFVAAIGEEIVGTGNVQRQAGMYHAKKFVLEIYVLPDRRGHGVGKSLYQALLNFLAPMDPVSLRAQVSEADPRSLRFATDRGFVETKRDFVSRLEVAGFHFEKFAKLERRLAEEGVVLQDLAEIDSPALRKEWYKVFCEVRQDVPRSEPPSPISYEFFEKQVIEDPELLRPGTFFAFQGGAMIGFSGSYEGAEEGWIDQWLTGVRRKARGRGVAAALKLRVIRTAFDLGFTTIQTDNDTTNAAMLAVNDKFGFVRQPAVLSMLKTLS